MAHVIHYAFKSTRATVQLVLALVLGLLSVLLLFSTVSRWRYEATLREAIQLSATGGEGDPLALLEEARTSRPDDLLPHLFVGQILLDKGTKLAQDQQQKGEATPEALGPAMKSLQGSIKAFDLACAKRDKVPSSTESAPVGACCARLALAELDPGQRVALLDEAGKILDTQVREKDDVDVTLAQAALLFARGDMPGCAQRLSDASTKLAGAGKGALGSYYWHKGLLGLMARDPGALDDLRRSHQYRHSPATSRMIGLALRMAAAETPKDPKELEPRLLALTDILTQSSKSKLRYELDKIDETACWNALGMAWMRVPNGEKAEAALLRAANWRPEMITYRVNLALSVRAKADTPGPQESPEQARRRCDAECAVRLYDAMKRWDLKNDTAAEKETHLAYGCEILLSSVGLHHAANRDGDASTALALAHEVFGLEDREFFRIQGALVDWQHRLDGAAPLYRKSIDLGHKDAYKMQERIDIFERMGKR